MGEERKFSVFPVSVGCITLFDHRFRVLLYIATCFLIQSFLNSIRFCNNCVTEQLQVCFGSASLNIIVPENKNK